MSSYPQKYLTTRRCCCCFMCDPRQVFLILSSTCLLLGLLNMCSYPLCPAIIISSLVVAFYYFGAGIYLLYAVTGLHEKLLKSFPWLMLFSYVPIAAYVSCLVASLECIEKWTSHYSISDNPQSAKEMYIGILCLYSMFAVIDFLFSSYSLVISMSQLEDRADQNLSQSSQTVQASYGGPFGMMSTPPTQVAYAAVIQSVNIATSETIDEDDADADVPVSEVPEPCAFPTPTPVPVPAQVPSAHPSHPPTPASSKHSQHSEHSHHSQEVTNATEEV